MNLRRIMLFEIKKRKIGKSKEKYWFERDSFNELFHTKIYAKKTWTRKKLLGERSLKEIMFTCGWGGGEFRVVPTLDDRFAVVKHEHAVLYHTGISCPPSFTWDVLPGVKIPQKDGRTQTRPYGESLGPL